MTALSVDFVLGDREHSLPETVLWDKLSGYGVFSGEECTETFNLDVLTVTGVVHALVVTAEF